VHLCERQVGIETLHRAADVSEQTHGITDLGTRDERHARKRHLPMWPPQGGNGGELRGGVLDVADDRSLRPEHVEDVVQRALPREVPRRERSVDDQDLGSVGSITVGEQTSRLETDAQSFEVARRRHMEPGTRLLRRRPPDDVEAKVLVVAGPRQVRAHASRGDTGQPAHLREEIAEEPV
jgi:hypothetical protein